MAIANKNDLTHIVRTTQQWTTSYDSYECIPEGVLCVEFTPDGHVKAKIGNGHDIFSKLPYIGGADLTNYFTKNETVKCVEDIIKAKRFIRIKGILQNKDQLPSNAECGDLYFVISQNQSSSNKYDEYVYSPSNTWENLGSIPIDIDLSEYAKIVYVDEKIDEVNERIDDIEQHGTHTHANKDILDLITAAFTAEEKDKLSTLYNYDDTELRELITQASHTHSNKDILDAISAAFTTEDRVKLDSLTPYDDTILKEKITALERLAHEHSNKRILDRTTASFTTEYERKMRWIRIYTGCTGMEEGIAGLVPAAQAGEEDYVLSGSGEWVPQTGGGGTYELPIATTTTLGGIKVGDGLEIDENGVLSATGGGGSGDSIAEGDGITITTDPQTGVKTISVNTGDHLEVDENTGELNVTGVDYEAGQGIFIGNEYQNVEYIKNSGNYDQIILTDIVPNFSDKLEMDIKFGAATGNTTNDGFIGCTGVVDNNKIFHYGVWCYCTNSDSNIGFYNHFVWTQYNTGSNFITRPAGISYDGGGAQRLILTMQGTTASWGNTSINFSNEYMTEYDSKTFVDPQIGISIFGYVGITSKNYFDCQNLTVYGVKLYDSNNTLLHNLVPVKKLSDNSGGLYDTVTNKFYGNSGNGSFVTGPAVETDDRIINAKIGNGLDFDSNNAIEVVTGNGLSVNQDNELEVNTGNGLQINQDGELEIDPSIIPEVMEYSAGEAITIRDVSSTLPAGYVEVDYIEGVGNYTVINYIPNRKTKIVGTASQTQTSYDPVLFGNRTGSAGQQFVFWFNRYDSTQAKVGFVYGTNTWSTSSDCDSGKLIPYTLGDQFTFLISLDDEFNINDSFVHNITENGAPASNLKLGIFALVNSSSDEIESSDQIFRGRMYEFKIYEDDELVVNLIPAVSTSTNQGGFYDVINDIFYTSKTATSFGYDSSTIHSTGKVIDVKYGNGLTVNQNNELEINTGDGLSVNANNEVELSKATANDLGGIKVGSGFVYTSDGLLNATPAAPPFDAGDGLELIYDDIDALPNGYGHVDYVCSNPENNLINAHGRARTLIDYVPTNTTKLAIRMQRDSERQDLCFIGSRIASHDHEFCFWNEYDSVTELAFAYGSTNYSNAYVEYSSYITGQIIEVECVVGDTSNTLSVNGTVVKTYTKSGDASPYKLGIFQLYLNGSWANQPANGKIYYIKLYEGNTLAVNLIPAVRLVDEVVGFYDNINDKFYTSNTEYPFTTDVTTLVIDGGNRTLKAKLGNGLQFDSNDAIEVNVGTGLEIDPQTGAINVTGGSGDTVEAGDGIDIDTDSQTGNKVISVVTGNGLEINNDNEVEVNIGDGLTLDTNEKITIDEDIVPLTHYFPGTAITFDQRSSAEVDIWNNGTGWANGAYISLTGNEYLAGFGPEYHSPIGNDSLEVPTNVTKLRVIALSANDDVLSVTVHCLDASYNRYLTLYDDTQPYDAWIDLDASARYVNFGVRWTLNSNVSITGTDIKSVTLYWQSSGSGDLDVDFKNISVNYGDGLTVNQDNELEVNIDAGDGIDITTDSQTGNKVISTIVQENGGLTIDEDTNGLKLDQSAAGKAINISDEITFDSWNNGTGWANEEYYDNTSNTHIPWNQNLMIYPTSTDVLFRIPDGVTQAKCSATSVNPSIALKTGLYFYNEQGVHFTGPTCSTDPDTIIDIPAGSVYVNQSIRNVNDNNIFSSNVAGATITWVTGGTKIDVKYGTGLALNQNNELEVNIGTGLEIDPDTGAINVTGGGGDGDSIAEGDGITITTDSQTGIKTIGINVGNGLDIDPLTNELFVNGQLPEGTIIKKLTYVGNGSGSSNVIKFTKKPVGILSINGSSGTNYISAIPASINSEYLHGVYGGVSSNGNSCSCKMSYNDATNELTFTQASGGNNDPGLIYNFNGKTYTMQYLVKGHAGSGTSENNEVSVVKTFSYVGTGTTVNNIQFPETPDYILNISGPLGSIGDIITDPMDIQHPTTASTYIFHWTQNGSGLTGRGLYSFNDSTNVLTLDGQDYGATLNYADNVYYVRYVVNEVISSSIGGGTNYLPGEGIEFTELSSSVYANKVRMEITGIKSYSQQGPGAPYCQMRYFEFSDSNHTAYTVVSGTAIWSDGTTVEYPSASESIDVMIDDIAKMCVEHFDGTKSLVLTFNLDSPVLYEDLQYFRYKTGADVPERDPISWKIYFNNTNSVNNWNLAAVVESATITNNREEWTQYFPLTVNEFNSVVISATGGSGDTIAEGNGISITTDQQTGEKVISVDIGSGLAFDPQTGAINVTGGGDTVAEGAGISITTDQQTGDKVIAINTGSGLQVNQTTNELEVSSGVVTSIAPTQNTPGSITVTEGDGTATPVSVISQMGGATSSTAGTAGYVPAPAAGDDDAYLRGDGTWDDSVVTEDDELTLVFVPDDYQPS